MWRLMQGFLRAQSGATAIEYGMICAMIVLAIIGSLQTLGAGIVSVLYDKLLSAF